MAGRPDRAVFFHVGKFKFEIVSETSCKITDNPDFTGLEDLATLYEAYPYLDQITVINAAEFLGFAGDSPWVSVTLDRVPLFKGDKLSGRTKDLWVGNGDVFDTWHLRMPVKELVLDTCPRATGAGLMEGLEKLETEDCDVFDAWNLPNSLRRYTATGCKLVSFPQPVPSHLFRFSRHGCDGPDAVYKMVGAEAKSPELHILSRFEAEMARQRRELENAEPREVIQLAAE